MSSRTYTLTDEEVDMLKELITKSPSLFMFEKQKLLDKFMDRPIVTDRKVSNEHSPL